MPLALAQWLEQQAVIKQVRYPGLPSHPQFELAQQQMKAGGGIITCELAVDTATARDFCDRLQYFTLAESLGGIESLACHPATMTHASVPAEVRAAVGLHDGVIRLSVGIESLQDLQQDLAQAMAAIEGSAPAEVSCTSTRPPSNAEGSTMPNRTAV